MTFKTQNNRDNQKVLTHKKLCQEEEKVLCPHCLRTANNGIKCKGICVADSDY